MTILTILCIMVLLTAISSLASTDALKHWIIMKMFYGKVERRVVFQALSLVWFLPIVSGIALAFGYHLTCLIFVCCNHLLQTAIHVHISRLQSGKVTRIKSLQTAR